MNRCLKRKRKRERGDGTLLLLFLNKEKALKWIFILMENQQIEK